MKKGWGKNTLLTLAAIVAFALLLLFNVITLGQSAETIVEEEDGRPNVPGDN